jgi:amino acid transporter
LLARINNISYRQTIVSFEEKAPRGFNSKNWRGFCLPPPLTETSVALKETKRNSGFNGWSQQLMKTSETKVYGLRATCLTFPETLSQSVANISPTLTPVVIVPLVFASAGSGTWLAYLFATIGLVLVGMNINQFAKRSASPGSLYSFVSKGLGLHAGFISGWCLIVAYLFTAMAVLAGSVNYAILLLQMLHVNIPAWILFGIGAAAAWFVAYKDIKLSTRLMLVLEAVSMLLIFVLGIYIMIHKGTFIDTTQFKLEGMNFSGLKAGLILAIFSFVGYESATTLGEEAKNPLKNIPRSVIWSALIAGIFFMLTSYMAVLGFKGMKTSLGASSAPFNDLADATGIGFLGVLISIGAVISMFACTLASINAGSRIIFMLGRHGILHPHLGKAHGSNETPHWAVTFSSIATFALPAIMLFKGLGVLDVFNDLSTIATYGFLIVYALVSISAPVYLKQIGKLTVGSIVLSVVSVLFMIPPIIATVSPTPAPPGDKFPYYFLIYLGVGIAWFLFLRLKLSSKVIAEMKADLEPAQSQ